MKKIISAISSIAKHINNSSSKKNLTEVAACYESGMSITQMQEILGISKRKVEMYLNKLAFALPYTFILADSKRSLKIGTQ